MMCLPFTVLVATVTLWDLGLTSYHGECVPVIVAFPNIPRHQTLKLPSELGVQVPINYYVDCFNYAEWL